MSETPAKNSKEQNSYKDTLNLPKTSFDMKANLTQREPEMVKRWAAENLYEKIRARPHPKGKWVLHDGPPYANGDIHMGHLINKVLKDIIVKFRTMQGYDSPYVPGWDCHGLPIESAIQKELGPKFRELTKDEVRKKCHDYAMKFVKLQADGFQRLGVFGDFARPYLTLDPKYEAGILEVLAELVQRDLVYRQKKPVHWCTNDRTALAEAELEYTTRKDNSIYVNFRIANLGALKASNSRTKNFLEHLLAFKDRAFLMIWTTTPWTLPANRAVAVNPEHEYAVVWYREKGESTSNEYSKCTIVAVKAIDRLHALGYFANHEAHGPVTGRELVEMGLTYYHPFGTPSQDSEQAKQAEFEQLKGSHEPPVTRIQPVVLADYVTLEDGTGLVHTAPGHGKEDYATGQKYGLEVYNPVLPDGRYDDTVPEFLRGKSIWDANQLVIDKLKETGALFHHQEFAHEYPHCWRCKKPVIFRATEQWFVKASHGTMTEAQLTAAFAEPTFPGTEKYDETSEASKLWYQAVLFTKQVEFIPTWGRNRLEGMLATRPDWCISRQRSWGVPIPAFFDEKGNVLLTEKSVRRVAEHFREHGADSWYTHTPAQLLGTDTWIADVIAPDGTILRGTNLQTATLTKGADILDVWFESGASHHAVLECTHPELGYPAQMYLEGSDQHRGWFQSSLLEAAGYKKEPPFKQVLTHGFIVDEKGRKMSKSEGNDIKVADALKQYGADVLRLWVSSVDYQNDIPCGPNLLKNMGEAYRKIRNTMRYLLGNLHDFNPQTDSVGPRPHSIDSWMEGTVTRWVSAVNSAYENYEFHQVFKLIYEFCNVEISAVYAKAIKDRLYCELPNSPKRRASQTVCYRMLTHVIERCGPILAFTADEAWGEMRKLPGCSSLEPSIHLRTFHPLGDRHEAMMESVYKLLPIQHDRAAIDAAKAGNSPLSDALSKFAAMAETVRDNLENWARGAAHWQVLMPLIEKGNKQLDDLKRTIGLGNPLDAEAVIVLPKVEDEVSKLIADYGPEIEDALGVGYHRIEHGEIWDIKINDTRNLYPSCARSWKRRPDVGSDKAFPDLSARDADVVRALRGLARSS